MEYVANITIIYKLAHEIMQLELCHKESQAVYYVHFSCNIWVILRRYLCDTCAIPG
jgi:hypothetical protein